MCGGRGLETWQKSVKFPKETSMFHVENKWERLNQNSTRSIKLVKTLRKFKFKQNENNILRKILNTNLSVNVAKCISQ